MSSAGLQGVTDIKTMLTDGWTATNTDNATPRFIDNLEAYWEMLDFGGVDQLYIKNDLETIKTGLYAADFTHSVSCTIEVMTARVTTPAAGRTHFKKMVDETMRIIKASLHIQKCLPYVMTRLYPFLLYLLCYGPCYAHCLFFALCGIFLYYIIVGIITGNG